MDELAELWVEVIGLFAGMIGVVAWVPQIRDCLLYTSDAADEE